MIQKSEHLILFIYIVTVSGKLSFIEPSKVPGVSYQVRYPCRLHRLVVLSLFSLKSVEIHKVLILSKNVEEKICINVRSVL